jgi:hypothetical protein
MSRVCAFDNPLTVDSKVLSYGQSEYVREFGMTVEEQPLKTQARVINAPTLKYHQSSKQPIAVSIVFTFSNWRRISDFMPATTRWRLELVRLPAVVRSLV